VAPSKGALSFFTVTVKGMQTFSAVDRTKIVGVTEKAEKAMVTFSRLMPPGKLDCDALPGGVGVPEVLVAGASPRLPPDWGEHDSNTENPSILEINLNIGSAYSCS